MRVAAGRKGREARLPFLALDRLRVHYEIVGPASASTLVLSNSLGTNLEMWKAQLEVFSRVFRVVTYDTRGHGQSEVTPGPYSVAQLAEDALAMLGALEVQSFSFCGLSLGGMIGMHLATLVPERVTKLVLCNTAPKIGVEDAWNSRIAAVEKGGMTAVTDAVLERWYTPEFRQCSVADVAKTREMLLNTPPEGYIACCAAVRDMDQRERIRQIRIPTLVIAGTRDPVTTIADAKLMVDSIQKAQLVELPAAHLSNIEAAEEFTSSVVRFLQG